MRRRPKPWEQELDDLSDEISELIDQVKPEDAADLIEYLEAAEPALREVRGPGRLWHVRRMLSTVVNVLLLALCIALMTGIIMYSTNTDPDSSFMGLRFYHVKSGSMTPTPQPDGTVFTGMKAGGFYTGDAIVVKNATAEDVKVHDVITFWKDGNKDEEPWTHRVMAIIPYENGGGMTFITKGDNNFSEDPPVDGKDLIGIKIFSVPQLGRLLFFAQRHFAWTIVFCVVLTGALFALFIFITGAPRRKRRRRSQVRSQDAGRRDREQISEIRMDDLRSSD